MAITRRIFVLGCSCLANEIRRWADLSVTATVVLYNSLSPNSAAYKSKHLFLGRSSPDWLGQLHSTRLIPLGPLGNQGQVPSMAMAEYQENKPKHSFGQSQSHG